MDVKEEILKILPKPANQIKLAHITTAANPERDLSYLEKEEQAMKEAGFQVENIDLEGKNGKELKNLLENKDIVYVQGGNTFYLLKFVKESGFDKVVKELIRKGVIYIGVSAGSYIACPTIEAATWKRQDRNVVGLKDLAALNLVPFLISAHYKSDYEPILKEAVAKTQYEVKILTDKQAILVQNGKTSLVGEGKEIKLS